MSEYVDFHYMPLEGKITGEQVLKQTEDAINDLGNKVYNLDVDQSEIDEAVEKSNEAINTANSALSAVTTGRSVWFNNVAEMAATDIEAGVTAETKGYYVANDGGNALYLIRQEKSGDVVDGGSLIALDNGNMAELVTDGTVNVKQFGAIGNGTDDDTTVFQNTSSYAQANGFVPFVGVATYKITSNITGTFNSFGEVTITGGGTVDIINLQEVVSDVSDIRDEVVDETASAKAYSESAATSATNASNSASSASTTATQLMAYLDAKETLTAPAVDPTLSISGAAADAEITGNRTKGIGSYFRFLDLSQSISAKRYYDNNGMVDYASGGASWRGAVIDVSAGEVFKLDFSARGSYESLIFADNNGNVISKKSLGRPSTTVPYTDYYVIVPAGATKLYVNNYVSGTPVIVAYEALFDADDRFENLETDGYFKELESDKYSYVFYDNSGVIDTGSSSSDWRSTYISVTAGDVYKIDLATYGTSFYCILFADDLGNVIKKELKGADDTRVEIYNYITTVPEDATVMYVNSRYDTFPLLLSIRKRYTLTDVAESVNDDFGIRLRKIYAPISATIYRDVDGVVSPTSGGASWRGAVIDVSVGEVYQIDTMIYGTTIYGVIFADDDGNVLSQLLPPPYSGNGEEIYNVKIKGYKVTVPTNATKMYINCRLPSDYETIINVYKVEKNLFATVENINSGLKEAELTAIASVIGHNRDGRFLNVGFITDTHINQYPNAEIYMRSLLRTSPLMDINIHGGDYITTENADETPYTLTEVIETHSKYAYFLENIKNAVLVQGNHDDGHDTNPDNNLSVSQFSVFANTENADVVHNPNAPFKDYWYKDFARFKVRLICLVTFDMTSDEIEEQLAWLTNTAFASVPADYTTIIFCHYLDTTSSYYRNLCSAIATFAANHSFAGVICGHRHRDMYDNSAGFNIIVVTAGYLGYDLITLDTANKVIYETRIGDGTSRSFSYGETVAQLN